LKSLSLTLNFDNFDVFVYLDLVWLAFKLRVQCLQSRCSTAWATPVVHFALVICSGWPRTTSLLISASLVPRIVGVWQLMLNFTILLECFLESFELYESVCNQFINWLKFTIET
jgi:hypothetical protein